MQAVPAMVDGEDFLMYGGEMAGRIRAMDWSGTSLGEPSGWPSVLKMALRIVLNSRQPMFIWWGPELLNLYNDAYKSILAGRHPAMLGRPAREVWGEIWDTIQPRVDSAINSREGTYDESLLLIMERNGYPEETYYTFSYSPILDDANQGCGIICANTDDTQRLIGARQTSLLRELATATADARTLEEARRGSARALASSPRDLPFALLYSASPRESCAELVECVGIESGHPLAPAQIDLADASALWPFAEVLRTGQLRIVDLPGGLGGEPPCGAWQRPPHQCAVLPLGRGQAGLLVVGLNPFRPFDESYRGFLELTASQIAAALANAQAYADERQRAETLATLDRAKTTFFSNVSHEFRTPLALILGPLEELLAQSALDADTAGQLGMVHRNAQRLLKLVNTLLDFSRIEAGRLHASYAPLDLATYTEELASVFRAAIEQAGLQLEIACEPLAEPVFVDAELWEKIVFNLLSNAFKYTLEGRIRVVLQALPGAVELRVEDTGIGIPVADLPHVFERFHRVENARGRTMEGSGIGLALVQELVRLHGGGVSVESTSGVGSVFAVSIPLGSAHLPAGRVVDAGLLPARDIERSSRPFVQEALHWSPEVAAKAATSAIASIAARPVLDTAWVEPLTVDISLAPALADAYRARRDGAAAAGDELTAAAAGSKPTVLLADDNADMREYVQRLLAPRYTVVAVGDGIEAFDAALAQQPNLVITDVMMPRSDGFALLQQLRAHPQTATVPVIMLSARAGQEARIEGLEAGADDYLMKPFSARELLARVESALAIAGLRGSAAQRERELRTQISAILESMDAAFLAVDNRFDITYANAAAERSSGLPRNELLGKNLWLLFPDAIGTQFERCCRRAVAQNATEYFEYFYPLWGRWYEINIGPMPDGNFGMYLHDITAQKSSEAALQEMNSQLEHRVRERTAELAAANARFQAIYDQGLFSGLMTIDGVLIDANRTSLESSGFNRADVIDKPLWDTGWWNRSPQLQAWIRNGFEQAAGGQPFHGESVYFWADGSERIVDFAFIPIKDEAGSVQFIVPTGLDITERRRAEQALQQATALRTSEEHFRSIFNHMVAGVAQTDRDGRFIWVNQRFCDLVGRSAEQLYRMTLREITYAPDAALLHKRFRALAEDDGQPSLVAELRYVRPDGEPVWVSSGFSAMRSGDQRYYVSIALDISARMQAEATLLKQTEKLRLLWEAAAVLLSQDDPSKMLDGIFAKIAARFGLDCYFNFMVDDSGQRLTLASTAGVDEVTREKVVQLEFGAAVCGWVAQHRERYVATTVQDSSVPREQFIRDLGVRAYVCNPLLVENRLLGTLSFASCSKDFFDDEEMEFLDTVTSYVTLAYERWNLLEQLRQDDRRKDEFLATLAHELRNPLAPLRNGLQIMRLSPDTTPTVTEAKNMMERQLLQMVRLVDELLDLSRINLGKVELHREPVELAAVLQSALEVSQPVIEMAGQTLAISIPAEPIFIEADTTRLAQVFINLLNNASKYTDDGGRIDLIATCADGEVVVVVKDNGIGIPAAHLPHVFEMFTQVQHHLEKSRGGLGIGLSIVKRLVEMHGGHVEVHSAGPGLGSELVVRLRVLMTLASDSAAPAADVVATPAMRRRILVADDNADAVASMAMLLELMGNEVLVAHDGQQACDLAAQFQPGVVILDIGMPRLNGYAACRQMRAQPWSADTTIIALTGWGQQEDKRRSEEAGFDHHLVKPVDPAVLEKLLADLRAADGEGRMEDAAFDTSERRLED